MSVSTARAFSILPSVPSGLPKLRDSESPPTPPFSTVLTLKEIQDLFDYLTELEVDGMMVSPGYSYEWAPDQDHFLKQEQTRRPVPGNSQPLPLRQKKAWNFNHNPLFLDFLVGEKDYECTPWGSPSLQRPRLAKALLPAERRPLRNLPGTARQHRMGKLRSQERQSKMCRLLWCIAAMSPRRRWMPCSRRMWQGRWGRCLGRDRESERGKGARTHLTPPPPYLTHLTHLSRINHVPTPIPLPSRR